MKAFAVLLSPLLAAGSLLSAAPAFAQVEVAPRSIAVMPGGAASVHLPAFAPLTPSVRSLSALSGPTAAYSASAAVSPTATLVAPAAAPILSVAPAVAVSAAPIAAPAGRLAVAPAAAVSAPSAAPAAQAAVAAEVQDAPRTLIGRLAKAVTGGVTAAVSDLFDGASARGSYMPAYARGIIAAPVSGHLLPAGVALDAKPQPTNEGSVRVQDFHLAQDHALADGTKPIKLDADAQDPAAVEAALRALVDANPAKYGASSSDMAKVHVQLVPGDKSTGQADTYYAIFRQWKKGVDHDGSPYYLLVDGGSLTFVLKVFADGKPTIMATEGRLYPGVDAGVMTVNFSDDEMLAKATARLQSPADALPGKLKQALAKIWERVKAAVGAGAAEPEAPEFLTRQLTNVNGTWRALNLYQAADLQGRPVIVAVDVKSGDAFAWTAQELLRNDATAAPSAPSVPGTAAARGTTLTAAGGDHGPTGPLPLPYANVYDASGKVAAVTAADGTFTVPAGTAGRFTLRLDGAYAKQSDDDADKNAAVEVSFTAAPGQTVKALLNPDGDDPELAADVNGYVYYSRQVAWLKDSAGVTDPRILAPLGGGVRSNRHDMPGNAYYSPADDSLNLQASAIETVKDSKGRPHKLQFENTAQPSIIYHESTHRAVQILSQIALSAEQAASSAFRFVARVMDPVMDGGVNEAIADTVSMYMRGSPLIGEGFYANMPAGPKNLIRTGENDTQFDPKNPDPHAQGEAYMGFTWMVRKGLIDALGEAAGAAYAALLVVPTTLYSQPQDVPTAMLHVLIGDMSTDGRIPHEAMIRAAASAHGPQLPTVSAP
jgi:hypothetical protein